MPSRNPAGYLWLVRDIKKHFPPLPQPNHLVEYGTFHNLREQALFLFLILPSCVDDRSFRKNCSEAGFAFLGVIKYFIPQSAVVDWICMGLHFVCFQQSALTKHLRIN